MARSSILMPSPRAQKRVIRRPQHTFYVKQRPWAIQPIVVAPVLAGETFKRGLLQSRVVSDPVDNPLIGWWLEYGFFYVKLRDMGTDRDAFESLIMDPEYDESGLLTAAANRTYYHFANGIGYTQKAIQAIVQHYYRADNELPDTYTTTLDGNTLPVCNIGRDSWLDSMVTAADYAAYIIEDETMSTAGDNAFTMSEFETMWNQYQMQKAQGLRRGGAADDYTFEDFLGDQGVYVPQQQIREDEQKPELMRYVRKWSYPTNTVDPTTGAPTSALSWSATERIDKDRFFVEPGFIIGVQIIRPKVYLNKQNGSIAHALKDAKDWLPDLLNGDPGFSYKNIGATTAPLDNQTTGYWFDVRDLFKYGDQFLGGFNFTTATGENLVALPTAAGQKKYPATTDADNLFATKTAGVGKVEADGNFTAFIATSIRDYSAST